jgi:2-furoyl-CoA dehydrogenase large subunit
MTDTAEKWLGRETLRREDPALLTGHARFIDDLEPISGICHAAILRSPHAHARIRSIDTAKAALAQGVVGIVTGADVAALSSPLSSALKLAARYYPCGVTKVRYFGEPIAVVVAKDRYLAEDAMALIDVDYEPLAPVVDPERALEEGAAILHDEIGSNCVHRRNFRYGDPEKAFMEAAHVFKYKCHYPRVHSTPIETYGVIANFEHAPDRFTIWSNFQGPFTLHPLMSSALKVPSQRLRLISPPASGGSFGIKQGVYPYMVLMAVASRKLGVPVKWTEDRLEHLAASSSATDRITEIEGAFTSAGDMIGLKLKQTENVGAYMRAPEPASLYRMHGTLNGPYTVRHIAVENSAVVTNQVPTGLNRGFGAPQFFFPFERLMDVAAKGLKIDPAELRKRNFVKAEEFPYECPAGSLLDSGDYVAALNVALEKVGYEQLLRDRDTARAEGRLFGIGMGAAVETSGSNMGYINAALTAEERARGAPKSGGAASVTITIDPMGAIVVNVGSTPNGQGHATVVAQLVADELGVDPADIEVITQLDTLTDNWSITSGNYANRFSVTIMTAVKIGAQNVAHQLKLLAAKELDAPPQKIKLALGHASVDDGRNISVPIRRLAAQTHWNAAGLPTGVPAGIRETAIFSPPSLTAPDAEDRIRSSLTYAFLCDVVAVEVDRESGRVQIKKYASVHDIGNQLNPAMVRQQIWGGFAHGFGAALFEQFTYDAQGTLLSSTFADYLCPTAPEMPELELGHVCSPATTNLLGAKGMGDGCTMIAPVAIANAVADAIGKDVTLPLTPSRVWSMMQGHTTTPAMKAAIRQPGAAAQRTTDDGRKLEGRGSMTVPSDVANVWARLLDPQSLQSAIPGCESLVDHGCYSYTARVAIRVAGIGGVYDAKVKLTDMQVPTSFRLQGEATGALGFGKGEAQVVLRAMGENETAIDYRYSADVGGRVASLGHRMLGSVTKVLIGQFFVRFSNHFGGVRGVNWWTQLRDLISIWFGSKS